MGANPTSINKIEQIAHTATFTIRDRIELLKRLLLRIDPEGRIAEELGAGLVPTAESREKNFLALEKGIDAHLVSQRVWLVNANRARAELVFKQSIKTSFANVSFEHSWREIVQEPKPTMGGS